MSTSSRGAWIAIAGVLAVAVGAAAYFLLVLAPGEESAAMKGQVEEWDDLWQPARACLVGDRPAVADGRLAIAAREALTGVTGDSYEQCIRHFKTLRRPGNESTGNETVERLWSELQDAVAELAQAQAMRMSTMDPSLAGERRTRLGKALAEVDRVYAALREAAGLEPIEPSGGDVAADAGAPIAIPGEAGFTASTVETIGNAVVVYGSTETGDAAVIARGPGDVQTDAFAPGVVRAAADEAWGLWMYQPEEGNIELRAVDTDELGDPVGEGVALTTAKTGDEHLAPVFALGDGDDRIALYRLLLPDAPETLWLARSSDGGETWPDNTRVEAPTQIQVFGDPVARRADLVWQTEAGLMWLPLRAEGAGADELPAAQNLTFFYDGYLDDLERCFAGEVSWWLPDDGNLYRRAGGETTEILAMGAERVVGCDAERAVVTRRELATRDALTCTAAGCRAAVSAAIPEGGETFVAVGDSGALAVVVIDELAVVHRGGADPTLVRTGEYGNPGSVVVWNGTPHVVHFSRDGARLIPLPSAAP